MNNNKCLQCGLVNFPGAIACRRCNTAVSVSSEGVAAPVGATLQPLVNSATATYDQANYSTGFPEEATVPSEGPFVSPYTQAPKLRTGHATASLVLGILGMFTAGLVGLGSLIGLGLGIRSVVKARNEPHIYGAKGVGIGGIVTNSLGLLSAIPIALIAAILIPNVMMARVIANEGMAIEHLGRICTAEAMFQSTVGKGQSFGDMKELIDEGLLPVDSAEKYGYKFTIRVPATESEDPSIPNTFEAVAVPATYGSSGRMSFYTSDAFVVRYADRRGKEATSSDDPIDQYYQELTMPFTTGGTTSDGLGDD